MIAVVLFEGRQEPTRGPAAVLNFSSFAGSFAARLDLIQSVAGRVAEWFKAPVLKTGKARKGLREFESHPFRHTSTPLPFAFIRRNQITLWYNEVFYHIVVRLPPSAVARSRSMIVGEIVGMGGQQGSGQVSAATHKRVVTELDGRPFLSSTLTGRRWQRTSSG